MTSKERFLQKLADAIYSVDTAINIEQYAEFTVAKSSVQAINKGRELLLSALRKEGVEYALVNKKSGTGYSIAKMQKPRAQRTAKRSSSTRSSTATTNKARKK